MDSPEGSRTPNKSGPATKRTFVDPDIVQQEQQTQDWMHDLDNFGRPPSPKHLVKTKLHSNVTSSEPISRMQQQKCISNNVSPIKYATQTQNLPARKSASKNSSPTKIATENGSPNEEYSSKNESPTNSVSDYTTANATSECINYQDALLTMRSIDDEDAAEVEDEDTDLVQHRIRHFQDNQSHPYANKNVQTAQKIAQHGSMAAAFARGPKSQNDNKIKISKSEAAELTEQIRSATRPLNPWVKETGSPISQSPIPKAPPPPPTSGPLKTDTKLFVNTEHRNDQVHSSVGHSGDTSSSAYSSYTSVGNNNNHTINNPTTQSTNNTDQDQATVISSGQQACTTCTTAAPTSVSVGSDSALVMPTSLSLTQHMPIMTDTALHKTNTEPDASSNHDQSHSASGTQAHAHTGMQQAAPSLGLSSVTRHSQNQSPANKQHNRLTLQQLVASPLPGQPTNKNNKQSSVPVTGGPRTRQTVVRDIRQLERQAAFLSNQDLDEGIGEPQVRYIPSHVSQQHRRPHSQQQSHSFYTTSGPGDSSRSTPTLPPAHLRDCSVFSEPNNRVGTPNSLFSGASDSSSVNTARRPVPPSVHGGMWSGASASTSHYNQGQPPVRGQIARLRINGSAAPVAGFSDSGHSVNGHSVFNNGTHNNEAKSGHGHGQFEQMLRSSIHDARRQPAFSTNQPIGMLGRDMIVDRIPASQKLVMSPPADGSAQQRLTNSTSVHELHQATVPSAHKHTEQPTTSTSQGHLTTNSSRKPDLDYEPAPTNNQRQRPPWRRSITAPSTDEPPGPDTIHTPDTGRDTQRTNGVTSQSVMDMQQRRYDSMVERISDRLQKQRVAFGNCEKCASTIYDVGDATEALGKLYHTACFTCFVCGRSLRGKRFYDVNGKTYCEEDYLYSGFQQTAEMCAGCGHLIMDMVLQAVGRCYHPNCFRCVDCNTGLDGVPFALDHDGQVYCVHDYHAKFAPRCAACQQPILPITESDETVRVVAMNRDYHVDCYICEGCGVQLTDEPNKRCYPMGEHLLCHTCHCHWSKTDNAQTTDVSVTDV